VLPADQISRSSKKSTLDRLHDLSSSVFDDRDQLPTQSQVYNSISIIWSWLLPLSFVWRIAILTVIVHIKIKLVFKHIITFISSLLTANLQEFNNDHRSQFHLLSHDNISMYYLCTVKSTCITSTSVYLKLECLIEFNTWYLQIYFVSWLKVILFSMVWI